ncbi:hypothetical protein KBB49_02160 [Candidatus Saccharibacteria bacterium]|nr:hypothetical protein [Candidatus Saccharibacteria bacterium]
MRIPKNYFHDRSVLALVGANLALSLIAVLSVLLGVKPEENPTSIVAYRDSSKIGQISGSTNELYQFAIYAVIVTVASLLLSMKLYAHRRHLAVGILGLNTLLLVLTIIIFNALTRTL